MYVQFNNVFVQSRLQAKICLWKYTEIFRGGFKEIYARIIGNCLRKKFLQVLKDSQHDYDRLTINIRAACWSQGNTHGGKTSIPVVRVNFQLGVRALGKFLFLIPLPQVTLVRELSTVGLLNTEAVEGVTVFLKEH